LFDFDRIPLGPFDTRLWWLLIAISIALLLTLQAIETTVEGAWPHQRRSSHYRPGARGVHVTWAIAAILVIPGALALVGSVAAMIWLDVPAPDGLKLGATLLAIGWIIFLLFGLNVLGLSGLIRNLGILGPLAILTVLLVSDMLLVVTLLDILPEWDIVRDAIENGLRDILPFLDDENGA
jgi:hypothetical protein